MLVSRKTRYALVAVLELARRHGQGPVSTHEIAASQAIPAKFLETILNELSRGAILTVRRGSLGGYALRKAPSQVTVGMVIEAVHGTVDAMGCEGPTAWERGMPGETAFMGMWGRVSRAIADVLETTTFAEVLEEEKRLAEFTPTLSYAI